MKRDGVIILGICVVAVVIGGVFFLMSGGGVSMSPGQEVGAVVLAEGNAVGMDERKNYRLTNQEEYLSTWAMVYGPEAPEPPVVDFATQEVLIAFDGQHPTGGYSVAVTSVVDGAGKREVTITHSMPGENCIVTDAVTSPFQIVAVPTSAREIKRTDIETVVACD